MIKKTILTALLLFALYTIYVAKFAPNWWHASQHLWQDNIIKAQKFLYNESDTIENVIVGSSLSTRFLNDSLSKTYNLSFAGQSIFDGLKILSYKPDIPKNIFIEMNVVLRPEKKEFTDALCSPIWYYPRKTIVSLQEDKQPIAVAGYAFKRYLRKFKSDYKEPIELKENTNAEINSDNNNSLFSKMLNIQINEYSEKPNQKTIDNAFTKLKNYVLSLEAKGHKIVFFEMPVNNKLEYLPKAQIIRETFYKYFPTAKFRYINLPDSFDCKTTDGVHLTDNEALRYTLFFKSKMKSLVSNDK